jgi:Spy/CpxP family protein refolding chaperone
MRNRPTVWAAALLAAAFLAGAAAGWALRSWREPAASERERPRKGAETEAVVGYLSRELRLTEPQRDSVRAVLQRARPAMDSLWREVRPRIDSLRAAMQRDIAVQLDSARRARYARLVAEREHRSRRTDSGTNTSGGRD